MYFLFQFLYSALLSADKADAVGIQLTEEKPLLPSDLIDRYNVIKFKGKESENQINQMRNEIYNKVCSSINSIDIHHKIFSLNVPTGTGKTLAGLSFALKLRDKISAYEGFAPKIIYSLPFLSIIEQNFNVFEDIFQVVENKKPDSRILLKHHHLAEIVYKIQDEEFSVDESRYLIEGWESEIVITTFMQIFHTIISNKNRMIRKFNAMVNSIVILDEIQTVPYRYWHLIRKLFLCFSEMFNTRFILMTATQPLIFEKNEITELVCPEDKTRYFEFLNRITFVNQSHNILTLKEFINHLTEDIKKYSDDSFLIVLNTINSSVEVFNELKKYADEQDIKRIEFYYLSTNIIPKHRIERIEQIKKSKNRKIVVSTQLIEAGVDIDLDRVYRDFAPFDSLNQVAGRCNRNFGEGKKGTVIVFSLLNENDKRMFYSYIYGNKDISVSKTKDVLKERSELTEKEFLESGNDYFKRLKKDKSDDDAEYMLKLLNDLSFETVCEDKKEGFRLIDSDYPTRDVFIEIDENASEIWHKYTAACKEKDPFKRKTEVTRLKKEFYNYVISVPAKILPGGATGEYETVFINKEQLETTYENDTGFIRKSLVQYVF